MRFEQAALSIASDLDDLDLSYALIGGFAVSIHTDPRFTQDIDLVVAVTDDDAAEFAVNSLVAKGGRGYARGRDLGARLDALLAGTTS